MPTNYENPFFSAVDSTVVRELNDRKEYYKKSDRQNPKDFEFPYRKSAFAIATLTYKVDNSTKILHTVKQDVAGWYVGPRYLPAPHISSVEVSSDGRYGLLKNAKLVISVYSIDQLNSIEKYVIVPGNTVNIKYGWSVNSNDANKGEFNGVLYNFSYSVRQDGGFDVTVDAVGRGMFFLHGDINGSINTDLEIVDEAGKKKIVNSIHTMITARKTEALAKDEGQVKSITKDTTGPGKYIKATPTCPLEFYVQPMVANQEPNWYITFASLLQVINGYINTNKPTSGATSLGNFCLTIPGNYVAKMCSADLEKIAFPDDKGMGYYNGTKGTNITVGPDPNFTTPTWDAPAGTVDLGRILINIELLIGTAAEPNGILMPSSTGDDAEVSVSDMLNKLFNVISDVSGGLYNLTIVTSGKEPGPATVTNDTEIFIVDTNYSLGAEQIQPYKFWAFTKGSILRDIQLSSELPAKLATAMYIGGNVKNAPVSKAQNHIAGGQFVTPYTWSESLGARPTRFSATKNLTNYVESSPAAQSNWDTIRSVPKTPTEIKLQKAEDDILKYRADIGDSPTTTDIVEGLKSALAAYKAAMDDSSEMPANDFPMYPLNLSVTLEGIDGIWFGNIITTNWMPTIYQNHIVFMVTKVSHSIQDGDWTTTLETQCRISFRPVNQESHE